MNIKTVHGASHDLLLAGRVMALYGNAEHGELAQRAAQQATGEWEPMDRDELLHILLNAGFPCLVMDSAPGQVPRGVRAYLGYGAACFLRVYPQGGHEPPYWALLESVPVPLVCLLNLGDMPRPDEFIGGLSKESRGEWLVVPLVCKAWQGRWSALLK